MTIRVFRILLQTAAYFLAGMKIAEFLHPK